MHWPNFSSEEKEILLKEYEKDIKRLEKNIKTYSLILENYISNLNEKRYQLMILEKKNNKQMINKNLYEPRRIYLMQEIDSIKSKIGDINNKIEEDKKEIIIINEFYKEDSDRIIK